MILQDILNEIRLLVPCPDLTDAQLVSQINRKGHEIHAILPLPDKFYRFQSTPSSAFYTLPADCAESQIKNVVTATGCEYKKVNTQENVPMVPFCTVVLNALYLYPKFTDVQDLYLYYKPRYAELSASRLTETPTLPIDYHGLLIFECAQWVAATQRDVDMVNNMQAEYDDLLKNAQRYTKPVSPSRVTIKERW